MKTTVFCATLLCLELVSSSPFPEQLPSYYGSYEPVGVPEQRVISQPIQIPNLAHSQNSELAYQQQQLAYPQQENLRRQNYEKSLRNQEQQQLNQRIASQLLIPPQPEHNYNSPLPLNTVRDPYISSIPLQRPIHPQYEAPITQQYLQSKQFTEPYQTVEPPQQIEVQNPKPEPVAEPASPAQNYQYNQQYQSGPQYKAQNLLYHQRVQQALATTPLKKRYLVLHPNGTVEHIDKFEHIVQRYPNYILVNARDLPKPIETLTPGPVQPVAPIDPGVVANKIPPGISLVNARDLPKPIEALTPGPVQPVAPIDPGVVANEIPPGISLVNARDLPKPIEALTPGPVQPVEPLDPGVVASEIPWPVEPIAPLTVPSTPGVQSLVAPTRSRPNALPPTILNGTVPGPKPRVPPSTGPTTTTKPVTAPTPLPPQPLSSTLAPLDPETTPLPPTSTANITVTPPADSTSCTPSVTTENSTITATATVAYPPPPPSDAISTTPTPTTNTDPTVTPPSVVTATATAVYPPTTSTPEVITEDPVTPAPAANATAIANATIMKSAELTTPDLPFDNIPTKPIVWFRSTDANFFDKLTSGDETFDIVYFFNIPREPRLLKDTKTTIHSNGTVVQEITETIYDDEDAPPRIVKTTKVTNPDDSKPKT